MLSKLEVNCNDYNLLFQCSIQPTCREMHSHHRELHCSIVTIAKFLKFKFFPNSRETRNFWSIS